MFAVCLVLAHGEVVSLPSDFLLPCVFFAAHGKGALCRVPDIMHTANTWAHGKVPFSGSAYVCCNELELYLSFSTIVWPSTSLTVLQQF